MTVSEAINHVCFYLYGNYDFYVENLFFNERIEEQDKLETALAICAKYKISINELGKHRERQNNRMPEPVRFIDRVSRRFKIETNELPF